MSHSPNPKIIELSSGALLVGGASGRGTALALGTAKQALRVNAGGTAVEYATLTAADIAFVPNAQLNISATDVQGAIEEVVSSTAHQHNATTNPTASNDIDDTAAIGVHFKTGDEWFNTTTGDRYKCNDATATAAVWVKQATAAGSTVTNKLATGTYSGATVSTGSVALTGFFTSTGAPADIDEAMRLFRSSFVPTGVFSVSGNDLVINVDTLGWPVENTDSVVVYWASNG